MFSLRSQGIGKWSLDWLVAMVAAMWLAGFVSFLFSVTASALPLPPPDNGLGDEMADLVAGAPRSWEQGIDVAPYSTVNALNGNMITSIPLLGWGGKGPDLDFNIYHNSADGEWRLSYSRRLDSAGSGSMKLRLDDGRHPLPIRRATWLRVH